MKLIYLVANAAWTFTFGDQLLVLHDEARFFESRREAVEAAGRRGLRVSDRGAVFSA